MSLLFQSLIALALVLALVAAQSATSIDPSSTATVVQQTTTTAICGGCPVDATWTGEHLDAVHCLGKVLSVVSFRIHRGFRIVG